MEGLSIFVEQLLAHWKVPGLALAVVKGGEVLLAQGFGQRDLAGNLPVTADTLFAIGSSTKAITTTAMGLLVDEGKLVWDTPVRDYLPFFRLHDPVASQQITPRDLVCHRSGLPRHDLVWYNSTATRRELVERVRYLEPNAGFRSTWQYQNLMYMVAGFLVGELAGSSWEAVVQQRIFAPLGMHTANFSVQESQQSPDHALPYRKNKDEQIEQIPFRDIGTVGPAGSVNACLKGMIAWVQLHLNKGLAGEQQLISAGTLSQTHTPQMVIPPSPLVSFDEVLPMGYGLGWFVEAYRGNRLIHHGGNIDGFSALVSFMPQQDIGVVVLTNLDANPVPTIVSYHVYDLLLELEPLPWDERFRKVAGDLKEAAEKAKGQAQSDRKPGTQPSHPLADYAGDYEHPGYGRIAFALDEEQLRVTFNQLDFGVEHYHYDSFELHYAPLELRLLASFSTDPQGTIASVVIPFEATANPIVFARVASQTLRDRAFLEPFVGTYELMGQRIAVTLRDEATLIASIPGQPAYELEPYQGTRFKLKGLANFSAEFKQDDAARVVALVLHQPNGSFEANRVEGE